MKLYYFDMAAHGEPIRLLLTHAGIRFEDVRIKFDQWPKMKGTFQLQQLPVLEEDGRQMSQSYAILEYLGSKYGYLPNSYDKLYNVLFIMNTVEDLLNKALTILHPLSQLDENGRAEMLKKLINVDGPLGLKAIEKRLKENNTQDFIVGKKYTIADFYILGAYKQIETDEVWKKNFFECISKKFPILLAYINKRMIDFNPYYKKCETILHYFDMPGRGEMIRLLLKHLGMPYTDNRIKWEDWPSLKTSGKFELQQLPVLECKPCGVLIPQSDAIMHYLGLRYGLLPLKKPEKLYKVVWWCNTLKDIIEVCAGLYQPISEDKRKELRAALFDKKIPAFLEAMESALRVNKSHCFLVGSKLTIADFYFVGTWQDTVLNPIMPEFKSIIGKFPLLSEYFEYMKKQFYQKF